MRGMDTVDTVAGSPRLPRTVIAGFVATVAMTLVLALSYGVALQFGTPRQPEYAAYPGPPQWMWALTHNPITELTRGALLAGVGLQLVFGLLWALVYAYYFEPRLPGRDWQRGALFALIPWFLSLVAFFPVAGGGLFGLKLGAGPLPILGNLILHLVYGATLGQVYGRIGGSVLTETGEPEGAEETAALASAERAAATGIVVGIVLGGLGGIVGSAVVGGSMAAASLITSGLFWALIGGAAGALVGTLFGLTGRSEEPSRRA